MARKKCLVPEETDRRLWSELDLKVEKLPRPSLSAIHRVSSTSSLGPLHSLPPELLVLVLNFLDCHSLSRLSQVSLRSKEVVESLPAYRELLVNAPRVLVALGKTQLLKHHSAGLLRQTLRSNQCVSCFEFGGFLFLPTCERACYQCLRQNPALRVTMVEIAKKYFNLTTQNIQRISILHSIPGRYGCLPRLSRERRYRLVSLKELWKLAVDVHGSTDAVIRSTPSACPQGIPIREFLTLRELNETTLEPPGFDLSTLTSRVREDSYDGTSFIRMAYLSPDGIDHGQICQGCRFAFDLHVNRQLSNAELNKLVPEGADADRWIVASRKRLRSTTGHSKHISTCYAQKMKQEKDEA